MQAGESLTVRGPCRETAVVIVEGEFEYVHAPHARRRLPAGAVSGDTHLMPGDAAMLRAVPLFGHLDEPRLSSLLVRSSVRTIATGTPAAVRGEPADRLLVVESGALTGVRETADGRRLRLGEFPAPCTVGKSAVLGAGRHTATWLAAD